MPARSAADWLTDERVFTTSVALLLTEGFEGIEWAAWDPLTLEAELRSVFEIREVPRFLFDRAQAAAAFYTTNEFQRSFETFSMLCTVMNGGLVNPQRVVPANLEDILWGVTESRLLTGISWEEEPFDTSISRYVGVLLDLKGVNDPPYVLAFAEYPERTRESDDDLQPEVDALLGEMELENSVSTPQELTRETMVQIQVLMEQIGELPLRTLDRKAYDQLLQRLVS